ncbi:MAG TPA: hypothetical protein VMR75_02590 [Candidatus Saccharimonadales bacterium]|nr:hypothetical protein [Candidatus Saccharimonadales bacterium]
MHALLAALQFLVAAAWGRAEAIFSNQVHPLPMTEEIAIFASWQVAFMTFAVYHREILRSMSWLDKSRQKLEASEERVAAGWLGQVPRWLQLPCFAVTLLLPLGPLTASLATIWQWPRKQAVILLAGSSTLAFMIYRWGAGAYLPQLHLSLAIWAGAGSLVVALYLYRRIRSHRLSLRPSRTSPRPLPEPLLR